MKSQGSFKDLADDAFGEDIQNFAIDIVSNLDRSVAEEMDKTDPYGWVRNNIILPLTKLDDTDRQTVSETYKKLLELNPNDLTAYIHRATYNTDMKKYDFAMADYSKIIELNPNNAKKLPFHDLHPRKRHSAQASLSLPFRNRYSLQQK